jgi:hypothetical protein
MRISTPSSSKTSRCSASASVSCWRTRPRKRPVQLSAPPLLVNDYLTVVADECGDAADMAVGLSSAQHGMPAAGAGIRVG